MAKHAHRLILNQKKTWRCTLIGCSYFIHVGLDHILAGKRMKCFSCGEEFTVGQSDVDAAKDGDDMLTCVSCQMAERVGISRNDRDDISDMIELKTSLFKWFGTNRINEVEPARLQSKINMGLTTQRAVDMALKMESNDTAVESIPSKPSIESDHLSDCASSLGMACDCKQSLDETIE